MTSTAVVTGASSGIGKAVAERLHAEGWFVAGLDLTEQQQDPSSTDPPAAHFVVDVTSRDEVGAFFASLPSLAPPMRLLVNSAGITARGTLLGLDRDDWDRVMNVNLNGVLNCMIAAAEQLQSNSPSTVVNLSSVAAARGGIGRAAYNASKAAVESISRTAAVEWASAGVTVNAISPGFTETPLLVDALHTGTIDEADLLARIPAGRLARTAEIADLVVFLASSAARYITGQTIVIDGGFLIDYGVGFKPGMTTERGPREG